MEEDERLARVAQIREAAMAAAREENERMAREAAVDCCDCCPHPKSERYDVVPFPNGVRLSVHMAHCHRPDTSCTAQVCSHLVSESPEVATRIVKHLVSVPELAMAGVSWMACLAPGGAEADRLILTYRVPQLELVADAVGALLVESFRSQWQAAPGAVS